MTIYAVEWTRPLIDKVSPMKTYAKLLLASVVLSAGLATTAKAQNAQWNALFDRIIRLESQVKAMNRSGGGGQYAPANNQQNRLLLNEMRQLRQMLRGMDDRLRALERRVNRSGRYNPPTAPRRRTAQLPPANQVLDPNGVENYEYNPDNTRIFVEIDRDNQQNPRTMPQTAPPPPPRAPAGNWQTKQSNTPISTPPAQTPGQTAALQPPANTPGGVERRTLDGNQVNQTDLAKVLFDRASSDLRSRRFGAAESGFKSFLGRYQGHKLAPSAQFMLGETYYVQKNWRLAAQTYLKGYRRYPKSSRANDNLLKLGMSLAKLGQKPQSCGAFETIVGKKTAPAATIARARKEMKRVGC